jgi:RNase P/RNase MRP subunit p29
MPTKVLLAVALAALLVPAAALAKSIEVDGPASLAGRGGVRGALHGEQAATVNLRMAGGQIRVTGAAAGLDVRCAGRKVVQGSRTNRRVETVVCKARGAMLVAITSKRFRLAVQSRAFSIQVPEGLGGTLYGNVRLVEPPADDEPAGDRPAAGAPARG